MTTMTILIPAAGLSSRMDGEDKLLRAIDGVPLLRRQAMAAVASGARVFVILRSAFGARAAALDGLPVTVVVAEDSVGLGVSLATGARAIRHASSVLILPADMPLIGAAELSHMIEASAAAPDRVLRGCDSAGVAGHPVVLPPRLQDALTQLSGDQGARSLIASESCLLVPLPGQAATLDLDTPAAWAAFEAGR